MPRHTGLGVLGDHRIYTRRIDRMHEKALANGRLYDWEEDGVSLAQVLYNRRTVARLLARTVRRGEHAFQPGRLRTLADDKERTVVSFGLIDTIVHGAIGDAVEELVRPNLSSRVYSYRPGVSWSDAAFDFAAYLRDLRDRYPDPRDRHLYVVCRDIRSYVDSVPVDDRSPIWPMLARALDGNGAGHHPVDDPWGLVAEAVRPEVRTEEGDLVRRSRGLPTGQPIACALMNLYASPLDRALDGVAGAFYARYSDDILFAHEEPDVVREADRRIDQVLARLGLEVKPAKSRDLYLTGAGRAPDGTDAFEGTTRVPYLGTMVFADGTIAMGKRKTRRFLGDIEDRAMRTAASVRGRDPDRVGPLVCDAINRAIDTEPTPFQSYDVPFLHRIATDRSHLAQLDHHLVRIAVHAATGCRDVRALRQYPPRTVREQWGLRSLVATRNAWGRPAP